MHSNSEVVKNIKVSSFAQDLSSDSEQVAEKQALVLSPISE